MNKRIRQAVLRILLLQEEFTQNELAEAATVVSDGDANSLIELLSRKKPSASHASAKRPQKNGQHLSKAVQNIKDTDPERYELLSDFERMIREESVLPTMVEIRKLGAKTGKDFKPGKGRREMIPKLMGGLIELPMQEMRELIADAVDAADGESDYHTLAEFLIHGPRSA